MDGEDTHEVQSLLDQGADPNHEIFWSKDWLSKNNPPLHTACIKGDLEIVKILIQSGGADADRDDLIFNLTPLQHAIFKGNKQVVEYMTKDVKCKVGE